MNVAESSHKRLRPSSRRRCQQGQQRGSHRQERRGREKKKKQQQQQQQQQQEQQQHSLDSLPPEVLETVLRFLPYRELANHVRLVNKRCSSVVTTILNAAFLSANSRLRSGLSHLADLTEGATDECSLLLAARAHNSLELVRAQYELLRAVCWRYTHPPRRQRFARLCFYAGAILDELDGILARATSCPGELIDKEGPAACVSGFGAMCKAFMNYFEKVSERKVNSRNTFVSGCKPVDVLDCLLSGRELLKLRVSSGRSSGSLVSMRLRYVLERAWFTCLEVPRVAGGTGEDLDDEERDAEEESWRDQQRYMYLRLRRLVGSANEHHLERLHYERERMMLETSELLPAPRQPACSTYSGYGEYGGRFFYYGNMNEYAYDSKIVDAWQRGAMRDRMRRRTPEQKPCYDLVINVELKCSPELAPLAVRPLLKCDDFENLTFANSHRPELYLRLSITCPASASNKLPANFVWELRSPRRYKSD